MRERMPLPKRIAEAPTLFMGLELFYAAFFDLHTCRPLGMSEGRISWLHIEQWADANHLDPEQREDLHFYIKQIDGEYLKWRHSQHGSVSGVRGKAKGKG